MVAARSVLPFTNGICKTPKDYIILLLTSISFYSTESARSVCKSSQVALCCNDLTYFRQPSTLETEGINFLWRQLTRFDLRTCLASELLGPAPAPLQQPAAQCHHGLNPHQRQWRRATLASADPSSGPSFWPLERLGRWAATPKIG